MIEKRLLICIIILLKLYIPVFSRLEDVQKRTISLNIFLYTDTCRYGKLHVEEDLVILVIQPESIKENEGFLLYAILLWPTTTFICACFLHFLRKWKSFITTYLDVFGILIGGGSFTINERAEKIFVLFLSIFALLFNIQFTDYLFITFTSSKEPYRLHSIREFFNWNTTNYMYEGLFYIIPVVKKIE